jgi:protein gp37
VGAKTGIEWTDATWNPIIGCSRVSEGCRNCYAETIAGRFGGGKETVYSGLTQIVNGRAVWTGQIKETKKLLEPLSWRSPKRVFVNSMSDLFHENVSDELRDRIFAVMALTPWHTFQVLTKRPERMLEYLTGLPGFERDARIIETAGDIAQVGFLHPDGRRVFEREGKNGDRAVPRFPLENVWLGVSVENQPAADERIPLLLKTPAAVRFISAEPLLGPVDLDRIEMPCPPARIGGTYSSLCSEVNRPLLDWVICGGESGPAARPMHPDWARSLRDQCAAAGVPFFFKQWGEWGRLEDHRGLGWKFGDDRTGYFAQDAPGLYEWGHRGVSSHGQHMLKVGKKAAGALLDGVEHKAFPAVHA